MLLRELRDHALTRTDMPPLYYVPKALRWFIPLTENGDLAPGGLVDLRPAKGAKGPKGKLVPAPDAYRSIHPPPLLLCDTAEYVLAVARDDSPKADAQADRRCAAFVELARRWTDRAAGHDPVARALARFLDADGLAHVPIPDDLVAGDWVGIMVGAAWVHLRPTAQTEWCAIVAERKGGGRQGLCLVCGEHGNLLSTLPESIKAGAIPTSGQARKTQLVSVNSAAQAREGVLQLANTPICDGCGSTGVAALNALLADERHRRRGTTSSLVWWTRDPIDDDPVAAFDAPQPDDVRHLLDTLHEPAHNRAANERVDPNRFYGLTLGTNSSRVVVHDWIDIPIGELRRNQGAWFTDHETRDGWNRTSVWYPLWRLTQAAGRWDKTTNRYTNTLVPDGLDNALLRSALNHQPPPAHLLAHLLGRIRSDRRIDGPRAALLRLILERSPHGGTTMPGLDPDATDPGYLCGRLFALYESTQYAALSAVGENGRRQGVNATVADKFYGSATTAPRHVLLTLDRGSKAHLKRLRRDRPGTAVALGKQIGAVWARFDATAEDVLPATLSPRQQARFALGYYHQQQSGFEAAAERAETKAAAAAADTRQP
ncbi:type I-C CRISPR-associated protein Cas8c/Csd1 [Embleya sp. NPDC020630]|uniref:type I-C CRISPR-associated protein Cas8c/Csd1 n=1 Tax=Embleya sp. NPDC020630 TaxID=3363979 RepID=UPI0037B4F667